MKTRQFFSFLFLILFCSISNQVMAMPSAPPMPEATSVPGMEMLPPETFAPPGDIMPTATMGPPMEMGMPTEPVPLAPPEGMEMPPVGPETVEISEEQIGAQGNWVKKREWLKEAQRVNDQIQDLVVTIQKSRRSYTDKYTGIDNELDTFYKEEGLEQGKVLELLNDVEKYLAKKRKKEIERLREYDEERGITGEYEIKLDILEEEVTARKRDLEQLRLDMKSIEDLDKSLSARLTKLDEQINIALKDAEKARKVSDEIWYIIDDKKARSIFYELKGNIFPKIEAIKNYVQVDLLRDFDNVIGVIRTQITKVKEGIKSLESKELIIRDRAKRLEQIRLQELEQQAGKAVPEQIEEKKEKVKEVAWYEKTYNFVVDAVARVYSFFKKIFGPTEKEKEVKKAEGEVLPIVPAPVIPPAEELPPSVPMPPPPPEMSMSAMSTTAMP